VGDFGAAAIVPMRHLLRPACHISVLNPLQGLEVPSHHHVCHLPGCVSVKTHLSSSVQTLTRDLTRARSTIFYSTIKPSWNSAQIGINVLAGIGQAGPLTLLPACIQYTSPHAYLSTATGLAFSARAIGGAFGSAVLDAIIHSHIAANYAPAVSAAAVAAGLPESSVEALLGALAQGERTGVPGATAEVWAAALDASHWEYAYAYRMAWASIIPFVVLALVAIFFMRGVKELMTEKVEATVELPRADEENKVASS
jgi:hypothetical protein